MQIRVSTKQLAECARRMDSLAEEVEEKAEKVNSYRTKLDAAWDGKSSDNAKNSMSTIINNLRAFADELHQSSNVLIKTAKAFEQAEGINNTFYAFGNIFTARRFIPFILGEVNGVVRIVPEEVRNVAKLCNTAAKEIQSMSSTYNSIISTLQAEWEGNSAKLFFQQSQEVLPNFKFFAESLDSFATGITAAAAKYEDLDKMFAVAK